MSEYYEEDEMLELDLNRNLCPVSVEEKKLVLQNCSEKLLSLKFDTCAVCDRLSKASLISNRRLTNKLLKRMRMRLSVDSTNVCSRLREQYSVSSFNPKLDKLFLSRRSFTDTTLRKDEIKLCDTCYTSLMKSNENCKVPPKFSIANGLFIGFLPNNLRCANMTERRLTSLANFKAQTVLAKGGRHSSIKSHIIAFSSQPKKIADSINNLLPEDQKILLIFSNPMTPAQKKIMKKKYMARKEIINCLIRFYLENNVLYKPCEGNVQEIKKLRSILQAPQKVLDSSLVIEDIDNMFADELADESSNIRQIEFIEQEDIELQQKSIIVDEQPHEQSEVFLRAAENVLDVQQHGKIVNISSKILFAICFPNLFPFGRGHFGEGRKVQIGLHEYVKYLLSLSGRQFSEDETFHMAAFDIISRTRALNSLNLSCKFRASQISQLENVTPEELSNYLNNQANKFQAFRKGHKVLEDCNESKVKQLLRFLRLSEGHSFATNEERLTYQRKAWNLAAKYGGSAFFLTVSPNENSNILVSYFAGKVEEKNLDIMKTNDIPPSAKRFEIATKNPVACSIYFSNILSILIDNILGFDMEKCKPKKRRGLLGVVKAFVGGIESQGKGTLHAHLIIFIAGFPRDSSAFTQDLRRSPDYRERVMKFLDSVINCNILEGRIESCPACGNRSLISLEKTNKSKMQNRNDENPYSTAKCEKCDSYFGADDLIRQHIEVKKSELDFKNTSIDFASELSRTLKNSIGITDKENDEITSNILAVPGIMFNSTEENDKSKTNLLEILNAQLVLLTQKHTWRHVKSCFKGNSSSKKGLCRYDFPRDIISSSKFVDSATFVPKRLIGCEYINPFNMEILSFLRSNMDIRFLATATDEIYYALKYSLKFQNNIDNIIALTISSYAKKVQSQRLLREELDNKKLVSRRIASMMYARTNQIEVSSVMCIHYILNHGTFVCSHKFGTLHLGAHLSKLDETNTYLPLVKSEGTFKVRDITLDYELRPYQLRNISLFEFVQKFEIKAIAKGKSKKKASILLFDQKHPCYTKKYVRPREIHVIPDIIGPRLPDLEDISEVDFELYCKIVLVLFKAHKCKQDLLQGHLTFTSSYLEFKDSSNFKSSGCENYTRNAQEYYKGKRMAHFSKIDVEEDTSDDGLLSFCNNEELQDFGHTESTESLSSFCIYSILRNTVKSTVRKLLEATEKRMILTKPVKKASFKILDSCNISCVIDLITDNTLNKKFNSSGVLESNETAKLKNVLQSDKFSTERQVQRNTRIIHTEGGENKTTKVCFLKDAINDAFTERKILYMSQPTNKNNLSCPSISFVSTKFTLNYRQNIAFRIIAKEFLSSIRKYELRLRPGKPLRVHIQGSAGTGKSRIVDALRFLALGWGYSDSIVTVAPTGIAAVNIFGETVHSKFNLRKQTRVSDSEIENWSKVHILIWDEISMTGQLDFARSYIRLRKLLNTPKDEEPRIHIVTLGDFAQLPPVKQKFVFSSPDPDKANPLQTYAFDLWRSFNTVIELTQNIRNNNDIMYGKILERLRIGQQTKEDFEILNQRLISRNLNDENFRKNFCSFQSPFACQVNKTRHSLNWKSILQTKKKRENLGVVIVPALFSKSPRGKVLSRQDIESLYKLGDEMLERLPPLLPLYSGMPVTITQNINPSMGIANGSTGSIIGFKNFNTNTLSSIEIDGMDFLLADDFPDAVYVTIDQYRSHSKQPGIPSDFPLNTIAVEPYKITTSVRLKSLYLKPFSVSVKQFPISPAFSSTVFKLQGKTCDSIVLFSIKELEKNPTSLYVFCSRVKTLQGLNFCEKLDYNHIHHFKPSESVLEEENRLHLLADSTIQSYEENMKLEKRKQQHNQYAGIKREYKFDNSSSCTGNKKSKHNVVPRTYSNEYLSRIVFTESPGFNPGSAHRIITVLSSLPSSQSSALPLRDPIYTRVNRCTEYWKTIDVPGDGNCWVYSTILSNWYLSHENVTLESQFYRDSMCTLVKDISKLDKDTVAFFERELGLRSHNGKALEKLSSLFDYPSVLSMFAEVLKVGTPNNCCWSSDFGDELRVLATILKATIVVFVRFTLSGDECKEKTAYLLSESLELRHASYYEPLTWLYTSNELQQRKIPILFVNGNHFQALLPPENVDGDMIVKWPANT